MVRLRWELCKVWKCSVDDDIFDSITEAQWLWYAQMIHADKKDNFDYMLSMAEYIASFWNAEAVQKVRDARETQNDERFATDEEFEKQILERDFKNDELIRAIKDRYKNTNLGDTNRSRDARSARIPKDMSRLLKLTGEK